MEQTDIGILASNLSNNISLLGTSVDMTCVAKQAACRADGTDGPEYKIQLENLATASVSLSRVTKVTII